MGLCDLLLVDAHDVEVPQAALPPLMQTFQVLLLQLPQVLHVLQVAALHPVRLTLPLLQLPHHFLQHKQSPSEKVGPPGAPEGSSSPG